MGTVFVTISCDWDGLDYEPPRAKLPVQYQSGSLENFRVRRGTKAFEKFAADHPRIPITHFICPVYYTRGAALRNTYVQTIGFTNHLRPVDEVALHIHGWRSLIEAAGVTFLDTPTWGDMTVDYPFGSGVATDNGHGVALGAYEPAHIKKIIQFSRAVLKKELGTACVSFRCGGWMANDKVLDAVKDDGFLYEASAVDGGFFENRNGAPNALDNWLAALWQRPKNAALATKNHRFVDHYPDALAPAHRSPQGVTLTCDLAKAQPTYLFDDQTLLELPDTGVLADYVTTAEMQTHIAAAVALAADRDVFVSVGFHSESGGDPRFAPGREFGFIHRILDLIDWVRLHHGAQVVFVTTRESGHIFERRRRAGILALDATESFLYRARVGQTVRLRSTLCDAEFEVDVVQQAKDRTDPDRVFEHQRAIMVRIKRKDGQAVPGSSLSHLYITKPLTLDNAAEKASVGTSEQQHLSDSVPLPTYSAAELWP